MSSKTAIPQETPATNPPTTASTDEQLQDSVKAQPVSGAIGVKPNRVKATVVGTPIGAPKQTDQPGVLQLVFEVEMTPTMPKGLPTLGRARVIVLCAEKQYRQAQDGAETPSRMIVEGEASTILSTAGKPLLIVVCTRLTTPALEQAKRSSPR